MTEGQEHNGLNGLPDKLLAFLIMTILGPWLMPTWERWNQPSKLELLAFFAGTLMWGYLLWTVVRAI